MKDGLNNSVRPAYRKVLTQSEIQTLTNGLKKANGLLMIDWEEDITPVSNREKWVVTALYKILVKDGVIDPCVWVNPPHIMMAAETYLGAPVNE
jgi:hypothetical protein